ncbi:transposase [Sphingobacteriaceae bacterium WQ 2009]|uniref:Transposase n=1 Tax=Rhinopithecimicrobium faecis TaxID=2820698 RepID=A0A8T4H7F2_9SPHI|nr:transposase [Sphingobacteriaceae bacterium WQ 2009]
MSLPFSAFVKYILPDFLVDNFELVAIHEIAEVLHITLEERNEIPAEYIGQKLISKGFFKDAHLQDFPMRGQVVMLNIKRRRWYNEETESVVYRDWNLVAKGTRMTQEFADFLKEVNQYEPE